MRHGRPIGPSVMSWARSEVSHAGRGRDRGGNVPPMPALLSDDYEERCLWQSQVTPPMATHDSLPAEADVVVVGAGLCGLAAADTFARAGRSVVVLEREPLCWGASSRNGGMVIPELKAGPLTLERRYGPVGRRMHHEILEAYEYVRGLATGADGTDPVACSWDEPGMLLVAHSTRHVDRVRGLVEELTSIGESAHVVERNDLHNEIGSDAFVAGAVVDKTGSVQPAALHAGLAVRAMAAGSSVHDRTALRSLERRTGGHDVVTTRGVVRAAKVVLATNAAVDRTVPQLERRVLPVGSYIIATEVLPEALAASILPTGRMVFDTRNFLAYWRLTPDGRLAYGGRRNMDPTDVADARDFLYDQMVAVHPQLAGVQVTHAWGGNVAMTLDRLPHIGQIEGAWYATGCNGSGVALNTWLGHRLAAALCGDVPFPACAELRHRSLPFHSARSAYLPLVGRYLSLEDAR